MRTHGLKCWPEVFGLTARGVKTFEWRRDDRQFAIGDLLHLREWDPSRGYTGRDCTMRVTYILHGPNFGIPDGFVVMSIVPHAQA